MLKTKAELREESKLARREFAINGKVATKLPYHDPASTMDHPFQQHSGVFENALNNKRFADGRLVNRLRGEY